MPEIIFHLKKRKLIIFIMSSFTITFILLITFGFLTSQTGVHSHVIKRDQFVVENPGEKEEIVKLGLTSPRLNEQEIPVELPPNEISSPVTDEVSPSPIANDRDHGKSNDDSDKELQLVHLVFRHGPRTPADTYPNDPYLNEVFYPFGWGQLTNKGKTQLYETGEWLRQRYNDFLGNLYEPDLLHAQATGVSRTHMSLQLVLAGLWPPKNTENEWNHELNWQPIPIYSEPLEKDTLLLVRTPCPRYYEELDNVLKEPQVKNELDKYDPMLKELTKITGMNIKTPDDVQSLYSTLRAEEEYGLSLPSWTKDFYPKDLLQVTEQSYIYNVYNDELKKLKGGPFVKKMLDEWLLKKNNKLDPEKRKLFMYTGHDSTVVNILSALNVWDKQFPTYGIMVIFELYKNKNSDNYFIQMYLRNDTTRDPYPLTIPGCEFKCPLERVITLTKPIIPLNRTAECMPNDLSFTEPPPSGP